MATQVTIVRKNYPRQIRSYTVMTVIVLLAAAVYGYFQYQKLAAAQDALAKEQAQVGSMQSSAKEFADSYTELKAAFDTEFASILNSIEAVYPSTEDYTKLTRLLDDFFQETNTSANPFFVSDLKFSKPEFDASKDFASLPFTMTITSTRSNFEKFLRFIETSGALEDGTRLLEITSISVNFSSEQAAAFTVASGASQAQLLNVSVSMNAYFQTPADIKAPTAAPRPASF